MRIRFATEEDAKKLLQIYEPYLDTPVTFEYTLPTVEEFRERIRTITACYPYLVCEEGDRTIGYAYGHRAMERAAYQWNAELSIYLNPEDTSRGLGKQLYTRLIEILKLQGVRNVYGCVTVPNEKSERLHLSLGFRKAGVWQNTGFKCGKWQDVAWFEKAIQAYGRPEPLRSVWEIPGEELEHLLG